MKFFINVLYGVLASPYFPVGNAVLADNITCRARVEVSKLSKSLNISQVITDGGNYSVNQVLSLKEGAKKPSLTCFADVGELPKHRSINVVPLADKKWPEIYMDPAQHGIFKELDSWATNHNNVFWSRYGLEQKIGLEHKLYNTALRTASISKADYAQLVWDPEKRSWCKINYVIRGTVQDKALKIHPKYDILKLLIETNDVQCVDLEFEHKTLLSVSAFRQIAKSSNRTEEQKRVRIGERFLEKRRFRWNNLFMPIMTEEEYQKRASRINKKKYDTLFERYMPWGIKRVKEMMSKDRLLFVPNRFISTVSPEPYDEILESQEFICL